MSGNVKRIANSYKQRSKEVLMEQTTSMSGDMPSKWKLNSDLNAKHAEQKVSSKGESKFCVTAEGIVNQERPNTPGYRIIMNGAFSGLTSPERPNSPAYQNSASLSHASLDRPNSPLNQVTTISAFPGRANPERPNSPLNQVTANSIFSGRTSPERSDSPGFQKSVSSIRASLERPTIPGYHYTEKCASIERPSTPGYQYTEHCASIERPSTPGHQIMKDRNTSGHTNTERPSTPGHQIMGDRNTSGRASPDRPSTPGHQIVGDRNTSGCASPERPSTPGHQIMGDRNTSGHTNTERPSTPGHQIMTDRNSSGHTSPERPGTPGHQVMNDGITSGHTNPERPSTPGDQIMKDRNTSGRASPERPSTPGHQIIKDRIPERPSSPHHQFMVSSASSSRASLERANDPINKPFRYGSAHVDLNHDVSTTHIEGKMGELYSFDIQENRHRNTAQPIPLRGVTAMVSPNIKHSGPTGNVSKLAMDFGQRTTPTHIRWTTKSDKNCELFKKYSESEKRLSCSERSDRISPGIQGFKAYVGPNEVFYSSSISGDRHIGKTENRHVSHSVQCSPPSNPKVTGDSSETSHGLEPKAIEGSRRRLENKGFSNARYNEPSRIPKPIKGSPCPRGVIDIPEYCSVGSRDAVTTKVLRKQSKSLVQEAVSLLKSKKNANDLQPDFDIEPLSKEVFEHGRKLQLNGYFSPSYNDLATNMSPRSMTDSVKNATHHARSSLQAAMQASTTTVSTPSKLSISSNSKLGLIEAPDKREESQSSLNVIKRVNMIERNKQNVESASSVSKQSANKNHPSEGEVKELHPSPGQSATSSPLKSTTDTSLIPNQTHNTAGQNDLASKRKQPSLTVQSSFPKTKWGSSMYPQKSGVSDLSLKQDIKDDLNTDVSFYSIDRNGSDGSLIYEEIHELTPRENDWRRIENGPHGNDHGGDKKRTPSDRPLNPVAVPLVKTKSSDLTKLADVSSKQFVDNILKHSKSISNKEERNAFYERALTAYLNRGPEEIYCTEDKIKFEPLNCDDDVNAAKVDVGYHLKETSYEERFAVSTSDQSVGDLMNISGDLNNISGGKDGNKTICSNNLENDTCNFPSGDNFYVQNPTNAPEEVKLTIQSHHDLSTVEERTEDNSDKQHSCSLEEGTDKGVDLTCSSHEKTENSTTKITDADRTTTVVKSDVTSGMPSCEAIVNEANLIDSATYLPDLTFGSAFKVLNLEKGVDRMSDTTQGDNDDASDVCHQQSRQIRQSSPSESQPSIGEIAVDDEKNDSEKHRQETQQDIGEIIQECSDNLNPVCSENSSYVVLSVDSKHFERGFQADTGTDTNKVLVTKSVQVLIKGDDNVQETIENPLECHSTGGVVTSGVWPCSGDACLTEMAKKQDMINSKTDACGDEDPDSVDYPMMDEADSFTMLHKNVIDYETHGDGDKDVNRESDMFFTTNTTMSESEVSETMQFSQSEVTKETKSFQDLLDQPQSRNDSYDDDIYETASYNIETNDEATRLPKTKQPKKKRKARKSPSLDTGSPMQVDMRAPNSCVLRVMAEREACHSEMKQICSRLVKAALDRERENQKKGLDFGKANFEAEKNYTHENHHDPMEFPGTYSPYPSRSKLFRSPTNADIMANKNEDISKVLDKYFNALIL